ncbi:T7SS effector LXG polymorphic toxin [Virgibacillus halodenitrificans]|uniref:T7SS effector LXG polymorphic toxin n=1 Tax=Virgibacillus halodenitrificans TaxID=1482 RepID=UPI0024BF4FC5|nr:T7SS effector LXG polymorphic toxin [Virgibacillus halodenitrificans]WHX24541.1 T7SS effector LXG polymorphic toxin [Virgibacillus halodenitrificans]
MKVLDVESLKNNITTSTKQIDAFQDKITGLQKAVRGIVSLEDSLKGTGGEAIRGFYDDCHHVYGKRYVQFQCPATSATSFLPVR